MTAHSVFIRANWKPDSFIGRLFKTLGRHVPPPPQLLDELNVAGASALTVPSDYLEVVATRA